MDKQKYKKYKLMFLEIARELNFITNIEASSKIPPSTLYQELVKLSKSDEILTINYAKYYVAYTCISSLAFIYYAESKEGESFSQDKIVDLDDAINQISIIPDTKQIIEKYNDMENLEQFNFHRTNELSVIYTLIADVFELFSDNNSIFESILEKEEHDQIRNVSITKLVAFYCVVSLFDISFDVALNEEVSSDAFESMVLTVELLKKMNYDIDLKRYIDSESRKV